MVETLCAARDLADHPSLELLTELMQKGVVELVQESGVDEKTQIKAADRTQTLLPIGLAMWRVLRATHRLRNYHIGRCD